MAVFVPALLCTLALLDGAFAGFRAACGHEASLPNPRRNAVSTLWGVGGALVGLLLIALVTVPFLVSAPTRSQRYDAFLAAGVVLLSWYVPLAVANLVAILAHFVAPPEYRAGAMMLILGPFTMARPIVIILGAMSALLAVHASLVLPGLVMAAVVTVGLGPALSWWRFRRHWPSVGQGRIRHAGLGR